MLNVYSNVTFNSDFFEFARQKGLKISLYDKYGLYVGSFVSTNHFLSTKTLLKQVMLYNNKEKRLAIGFVHAANSRSESLNLDIAEIFKPIIVDKVIFAVINKGQILKERHFEQAENGGILLNKEGKRIFIHEIEDKLYQKITIDGKGVTYDAIIRNEVYKIFHTVTEDVKYKPFKYT